MGKTTTVCGFPGMIKKHPHARGEDPAPTYTTAGTGETPPRAWGRPFSPARSRNLLRNTPTRVGKTIYPCWTLYRSRKHPHARGEDTVTIPPPSQPMETPPRAWGRPDRKGCVRQSIRNTPTRVGKTPRAEFWYLEHRNTPTRVGKTPLGAERKHVVVETPPRAWGRPWLRMRSRTRSRNTPTRVGKTRM